MNIFRDKNGSLNSDGPSPAENLVTLGDAAYDWGTAPATLGLRPKFILLPATAPRVLTMPPEVDCAGWRVFVKSSGASTVQVNNDAGTGAGGSGTIAGGATGEFYCDGTTWFAFVEAPAA